MPLRDLVALALLALAAPAFARGEDPLALAAATERALASHPEVRQAEADVRAARARAEGASALLASNPEASVAAGPRRDGGRRSTDWEASLSQRVEIGGQRGARIAAARAEVAAAEARLAARRASVAGEVRELLGRLAAARLRTELADEALRVAEQVVRAAERRFATGDAPRIEVNGARVELGRAARAASDAGQEREAAAAGLELALGYAPGTLPETAHELGRRAAVPDGEPGALAEAALARRPDVAAARLDLAAAQAERTLAGRSAVPDPALGVSYAREEDASIVLGTLSFELPLFARNRAERGVASARVDRAGAALSALEARVRQEVRLAAERARAARASVAASRDGVLPAAIENLALVTRAYEAGQLDLARFLLLRREALAARNDHVEALEALDRAEAALERAVGAVP
jgi:cobalt-zinc-cadmium efflux system outer membrane protein